MRERPNRHAWKACEVKASVGSNPTPSAVDFQFAMGLALDEARHAIGHGDVPVGAVILRSGEVIAARHNEREVSGDPTAHAEILVLRDAAKRIGGWNLKGCELIVTVEPCAMCAGAALAARIDAVIFGTSQIRYGAAGSVYNLLSDPRLMHEAQVISGVCAEECAQLMEEFFRSRRGV